MNNQPEVHFSGKVAQKGIIVCNDQVLLIRDGREAQEIWELPGGRLNEGELPQAGLARELKEELGVDALVHEVVHMEQFFRGSEGKNALLIAYRVSLTDNAALVLSPQEVAEVRWVGKNDWQAMRLFSEYKRALEVYFSRL